MWNNPNILNRLSATLFISSLIALSILGMSVISKLPIFDLEKIIIVGNLHDETKILLKHVVRNNFNGGFFTIDLKSSKKLLEAIPRVNTVSINREWPNALEIVVKEHTPLGLWGEKKFLSDHGRLVIANVTEEALAGMPKFSAPDKVADDVMKFYKDGNQNLMSIGREIKEILVNDRYTWKIILDDGVILRLGKEKHLERLQVFINFYQFTLGELESKIDYIDMRYEDGFAIGVRG